MWMTMSMVMVLLLLIHWIHSQYEREERSLLQSVVRDIKEADRQFLDSALVDLIPRELMDRLIFIRQGGEDGLIESEYEVHVMSDTIKHDMMELPVQGIEKEEVYRPMLDTHIVYPSGSEVKLKSQISADGAHTEADSMVVSLMFQGIESMVRKIDSEVKSSNNSLSLHGVKFDQDKYQVALKKVWSNPTLNYELIASKKHAGAGKDFFPLGYAVGDSSWGVQLQNKQAFLFLGLSAEMGFALLLLLVTLFAFSISYRSLRKQARLNQMRIDFINNISHELKTPLSTQKVLLESLNRFKRKQDPKVLEEYLEVMARQTDRLDHLVHHVLRSSLLDKPGKWGEFKRLDLVSCFNEQVAEYQLVNQEKDVEITLSGFDKVYEMEGDELHLQGLLLNLLDNGIKYVPEPIRINLELIEKETTIEIWYRDNGPGIPSGMEEEIFERFYRIQEGDIHNVNGYGLGLTYARRVAKLHGGSLRYVKEKEVGATFLVELKKEQIR